MNVSDRLARGTQCEDLEKKPGCRDSAIYTGCMAGELLAIWLKRARGGPMDPVSSANLVPGRGLAGNANQGGRRQLTLIEQEVWDALMSELRGTLPPSARRANLMFRNLQLARSRARILRVGPTRLRILGETKPCEQMEAAFPGLKRVMEEAWRGGAYGEVLDGGVIRLGDAAEWEPRSGE